MAAALFLSVILSGFTRINGIGNVYYSTEMEIFKGVSYSRVLAGHDQNGVERAHVVTADMAGTRARPVVFSGEAGSKYVLDTMIDTLEAQGYKVLAGVNGDLFSTDTACPRGLTIHDGIIQSSGYDPQFVVAFDAAGKAELSWTNASYGLNTRIYVPQPDGAYLETPFAANIGFFNVPHGGAKALHLYNRLYGSSTKTKGKNVEVVLDAPSYADAMLRFGKPLRATVAWIQYEGADTPIGDNQLVLSTDFDSATAESLKMLAPGAEVEIYASDSDNGPIGRASECLGMYMLLYNNGAWVNTGTRANPRTLLGLKPDGSVLLYVLDGRQPGYSSGLGLTDAASHLVALGCSVVANLDGGGSSTIAVREPGRDAKATVKNSPSDGAQRAVANGLFFVYRDLPDDGSKRLSVYQDNYLAMPGATVQLSPYLTNSLYEKEGFGYTGNVSYEVLEGEGEVNQYGAFTAGEKPGTVKIRVHNGSLEAMARVEVTDAVSFVPNRSSVLTDPGAVTDISVTASHGYAPIAQRDSLFKWECDESIGSIDGFGVFTAVGKTGVSGAIRVSYGGEVAVIPVQVGSKISFADLVDQGTGGPHWAKPYIEALAAQGMVSGIGGDMFGPDDQLTRAQFLAMLAKTITRLDLSQAPAAGFTDVPAGEWYYGYVNWGFAAGIVKGVDESRFEPDAPITREQMTVMLNNFAVACGVFLPSTAEPPAFTDSASVSDWSVFAVGKIVGAGIMNGMPEGDFAPQGRATRAQAAKVTYALIEIYRAYPQNAAAGGGISPPPLDGEAPAAPVASPGAVGAGATGAGVTGPEPPQGQPGTGASGGDRPNADDSGSESTDVVH